MGDIRALSVESRSVYDTPSAMISVTISFRLEVSLMFISRFGINEIRPLLAPKYISSLYLKTELGKKDAFCTPSSSVKCVIEALPLSSNISRMIHSSEFNQSCP